jgi:hypothetical protein
VRSPETLSSIDQDVNIQIGKTPHLLAPLAMGSEKRPAWPVFFMAALIVLAAVAPPGLVAGIEICLLLLAMASLVTASERIPTQILQLVVPFFLICVVGLLVGIGADLYLYLKDVWYIFNPALAICTGFLLFRCRPDMPAGLRALVGGGVAVAAISIVPFILNRALLTRNAEQIRYVVGQGYFAPVMALSILMTCRKGYTRLLCLPPWVARMGMVLCVVSIGLSFSRTIVITALIGLMASFGVFARRAWLKVTVILAVCVFVFAVARMGVDIDASDSKHTFMGKLVRSFDEMALHDYYGSKEINENWRGYESARALRVYSASDPWRWILGQGFGAELDAGVWVPIGRNGALMRYLPILHNGYIYLLFKGGALAIAFYAFVLTRLYLMGRSAATSGDEERGVAGVLLQAIAIGLAFTTWVLMGPFKELDLLCFLVTLGYLCGRISTPYGTIVETA